MLPCCLRLLFNCISKAKMENSIVLCVIVNFPPPFSCSWAQGFNPCSEGDNAAVLRKAPCQGRAQTGALDSDLCLEKTVQDRHFFHFFLGIQAQRARVQV